VNARAHRAVVAAGVAAFVAFVASVSPAQQPYLQIELLGGGGRATATEAQVGHRLGAMVRFGVRGDAVPADGMAFGSPEQSFHRHLQVELLAADGKVLPAHWSWNAPYGLQQVVAGRPLMLPQHLDEYALGDLRLAPGRYGLRARYRCDDGPGWRGELLSPVAWFSLLGHPRPDAVLLAPAGGQLTPGAPLLVGVQFVATDDFTAEDSWQAPGFDRERLPDEVRIAVRGPDGAPAKWPIVPFQASVPAQTFLRAGGRIGTWWLRLPGDATAKLAPGRHELVLHVDQPEGAFASGPLAIQVLDATAAAAPDARLAALCSRLAEVRLLRQHAQRVQSFLSWQVKLFDACAASLRGIAAEQAALAAVAPGPRVELVRAEWLLLRDERQAALAVLDALPPPGDDSRLGEAIAVLRTRATAATTATDDYFAKPWQQALQRCEAAAKPPPPQPAPIDTAAAVQWASAARASSSYRDRGDYSAERATGAPDVPKYGDHVRAWCPKTADGGAEWLELDFDPPAPARGVRVVQNLNPGKLVGIDLTLADGTVRSVWTGPDATAWPANQTGVFETTFTVPESAVVRVRLRLDTKGGGGWVEIDAVGLLLAP
jgi:hypothetical protein